MSAVRMSITGDDSAGWTWGVWVDNLELFKTEPLARNDLAVALFSVRRDTSRQNPFFRGLSNEDLFFILDGFFFGTLHDALRASAEEQVWARHLVSPSLPVAIWSRMYLVAFEGDPERLLVWQNGTLQAFSLAEGSFDKELSAVVESLETGLDQQE